MKDYMAHIDEAVDRTLEEKGRIPFYSTDEKALKIILGKEMGKKLDYQTTMYSPEDDDYEYDC
jgi:hypothetical protein